MRPIHIWVEQILIFVLICTLLISHRNTIQRKIKKYRQRWKDIRPRKWKPKSPKDYPDCQAGISLTIFRPKTDVIPYSERKSTRGRRKNISTQGHACPNSNCDYFGVIDQLLHALVGDGKRGKKQHIQYWKCQWCDKRFTCRLHTPLYRLKTDNGTIVLVLMLLAEGVDLSVMVRCSGHSEASITRWLERMGRHSSLLHNQYFRNLVLVFAQLDELYCRVRRAGKKWVWLVIDPGSKILPSFHLGDRRTVDGMSLLHDLKSADCIPALTADGLRAYFYAITAHFGYWYRPKQARTDHWQVSDDLLFGQLIKRRRSGSSKFTIMRMLWGQRKTLNNLLKLHGFAPIIQTAFIERVNLTIRRGVAPLMRKTWSLAQSKEHLSSHIEWWRTDYHFVRPHSSLALPVPGLGTQRKRSPAQAAQLTSRLWTVEDILKLPIPPVSA